MVTREPSVSTIIPSHSESFRPTLLHSPNTIEHGDNEAVPADSARSKRSRSVPWTTPTGRKRPEGTLIIRMPAPFAADHLPTTG